MRIFIYLMLFTSIALCGVDELEIAEKDFPKATPKLKQIVYKMWQGKVAQLPNDWDKKTGEEKTNWCFTGWVLNSNALGVVTSRTYSVTDHITGGKVTDEFISKETKELERVIPKDDFVFKKEDSDAVKITE